MDQSKNGLFRLSLVILLIAGMCQPVMAIEPQPSVPVMVDGTVMIGGETAPEGTVVSAVLDGECVAEHTVSEDGKYLLTIPGESSGESVALLVNGVDAQKLDIKDSSEPVSLDLAVDKAPKVTKKSSSSKSGSRSVSETEDLDTSKTETGISESSAKDKENPESVEPSEGTHAEESADTKTEQAQEESTESKTPGFDIICGVAGILLYAGVAGRKS